MKHAVALVITAAIVLVVAYFVIDRQAPKTPADGAENGTAPQNGEGDVPAEGDAPDDAEADEREVVAVPPEAAELVDIDSPEPRATITSPLVIDGRVSGLWLFEATAPVVLVDWDGRIIAEGYIEAEGEWMTEALVAVSGELSFELPDELLYPRGTLIFQKANPSGLPENDAAVEIPVTLATTSATST